MHALENVTWVGEYRFNVTSDTKELIM